mmetsp:Transcript_38764/g.74464  ORF Transcript_38764/g.74464 Transcript_38764/m.74464 type:complete len:189 (-) Transcript_38764:100-666(-)
MGGKSSTPVPPDSKAKHRLAREKFMKAHSKTFGGATISMEEAKELERKGQRVVFVDIRTPAEQEVSRFPKSIDEEEFWKNKDSYKDSHVVSYCTIGFRSGVFAQKLKKLGYPHVYNGEGVVLWTYDEATQLVHREKDGSEVPVKKVHVYGNEWDLAADSYETVKFSSTDSVTTGFVGTVSTMLKRLWR